MEDAYRPVKTIKPDADFVNVQVEYEYECLDRLGPRVRAVLTRRCAFIWSAFDVLRHMGHRDMDPDDPETDRKMADKILAMDHKKRESRG